MNIKKIDKDDIEEIFVLLGVLVAATHCDNAVTLEITRRLLEKFKRTVGFSDKDKKKIESIAIEYNRRVSILKEGKKEGATTQETISISLDERSRVFWELVSGNWG